MQPNCYWRDKWEGERRVNQDKRRVFSSNTSKLLMTGTQQGLYFQILLWQLLVTRFQLALIDAIQQALDCLLAEQFYTDLRSILLMLILIKCTNPEHRYAKACELKKKLSFFTGYVLLTVEVEIKLFQWVVKYIVTSLKIMLLPHPN